MRDKKNFFYRINPESVLSEVTNINYSEWLQWFLDFFHDLRNDDPLVTKTRLASNIINEAHVFRSKRAVAGKKSAEQRATKDQQEPTYDEHMLNNVQPVAVAVAVTETIIKRKPKKICAFDNARLSDFNLFWDAFGYKKGKGGAEKAWMKIRNYSAELVENIIESARAESQQRMFIVQRGGTPKWAEGWLNERRWEDEVTPIIIPMSDREIREARGLETLRLWGEGQI